LKLHSFWDGLLGTGTTATTVGGDATVTLTNGAGNSITIDAIADATGTNAYASAYNYYALFQSASAYGTGATPVGGNAVASIANDGAITIGAAAAAYGTNNATAYATVYNPISQDAHAYNGGNATVSLTGDGSIDIGARAHAYATEGEADAVASVSGGISQFATAYGGGARVLSRSVSCGLGEGTIAKELAALQERYSELEIGSYPYFRRSDFGVTLVVRGTDRDRILAAIEELKVLIRNLGGDPQEGLAED